MDQEVGVQKLDPSGCAWCRRASFPFYLTAAIVVGYAPGWFLAGYHLFKARGLELPQLWGAVLLLPVLFLSPFLWLWLVIRGFKRFGTRGAWLLVVSIERDRYRAPVQPR